VKIIDVVDSQRINRIHDKTVILMSSDKFLEHNHIVRNVHLNLYVQKKDDKLGPYSLITAFVETDEGTIEMTYNEGYMGENALEEAVAILTLHLGISGLISRSIIQLENLQKHE